MLRSIHSWVWKGQFLHAVRGDIEKAKFVSSAVNAGLIVGIVELALFAQRLGGQHQRLVMVLGSFRRSGAFFFFAHWMACCGEVWGHPEPGCAKLAPQSPESQTKDRRKESIKLGNTVLEALPAIHNTPQQTPRSGWGLPCYG